MGKGDVVLADEHDLDREVKKQKKKGGRKPREEKSPLRNCEYQVHKAGGVVTAHFRGAAVFKRAEAADRIPFTHVCCTDTESLKCHAQNDDLTTLITSMRFHDRGRVIETPDGKGMLEGVFESMWAQDWAEKEERPSYTKQREKNEDGSRDGERQKLSPKLMTFFNFPYDIGRMLADRPRTLETVAAGADSYRVTLGKWELEVRRMILGTAPSFDWRIRHPETKTAMRLLGLDLVGYWKSSLAKAAAALGCKPKEDIEKRIEGIYEKFREDLAPEEWKMFLDYALGDAETTLELYHRTCDLLVKVDPRVVRKTGAIPPSAPGASARIVFAKAFDCHDGLTEWKRYPAWADQMGCDSYYGGRAFCSRPGIHARMSSFDLKSAYPAAMCQLPDPVTVRMSRVAEGKFILDWYRGRFGVLCISGYESNDVMPAFRVHDDQEGGRLRYVAGKFNRVWVTIPECVIGVLRGTLRIDRVHDGVVMMGESETSFIRAGIADFFAIKENPENEKALRDMAKLLANSFYGKLIEVTCVDYHVGEEIIMPSFEERGEISRSITLIFACGGAAPYDRLYWGWDEKRVRLARNEYARVAEKLVKLGEEDAPANAIYCYVEALRLAGERYSGKPTTVGRFVASHKKYKCGQYFMPLYATQITGLTSASVGLMADCLDAWQGDTDSVHFQLPVGEKKGDVLPGWKRYFEIMREAGYHAPRRRDDGTYEDAILEQSPNLGSWEQESDEPSVESLLVRPKLYSHKFPDKLNKKTGKMEPVFKQAKHGFAKFHTLAIEATMKDMGLGTREARTAAAELVRSAELHRAMREVYERGEFTYTTRPAPLKLRTAIKSGRTPGRFESRLMKMMATTDPNNYLASDGLVRWLGEGLPAFERKAG